MAVGSPQPDVQLILRRLDFPSSAREALVCLGNILVINQHIFF
jgi:hypothetical protein